MDFGFRVDFKMFAKPNDRVQSILPLCAKFDRNCFLRCCQQEVIKWNHHNISCMGFILQKLESPDYIQHKHLGRKVIGAASSVLLQEIEEGTQAIIAADLEEENRKKNHVKELIVEDIASINQPTPAVSMNDYSIEGLTNFIIELNLKRTLIVPINIVFPFYNKNSNSFCV